jgi:hypothetical protein
VIGRARTKYPAEMFTFPNCPGPETITLKNELLSALRAHTEAPYKPDLRLKTIRALKRPSRARTVWLLTPCWPRMVLVPARKPHSDAPYLGGGGPSQPAGPSGWGSAQKPCAIQMV